MIAQTSIMAYYDLTPSRKTQQYRILQILYKYGPLTADAICESTGIPQHVVSPRLLELRQQHKVIRLELKAKTRSGKEAYLHYVV